VSWPGLLTALLNKPQISKYHITEFEFIYIPYRSFEGLTQGCKICNNIKQCPIQMQIFVLPSTISLLNGSYKEIKIQYLIQE
jgi:hypothetical protein